MSSKQENDLFMDFWGSLPENDLRPAQILYLCGLGLLIGLAVGSVIAIFRITSNMAYSGALGWIKSHHGQLAPLVLTFILAATAALITGKLIQNPAIRYGGQGWIRDALNQSKSNPWRNVLLPKFIGSWLVMACGISVGREGPCIEMGAATALGLKRLNNKNIMEQRYLVLGGCAAGLAAAFSAPFAGICYVFEIMQEKFSRKLLLFLLAGSLGVYLSTTMLFGLKVMLPVAVNTAPDFIQLGALVVLAILAGGVGIAYNFLLRFSIAKYTEQHKISLGLRPLLPFLGAALMLIIFPAITGEGLNIFSIFESGQSSVGYLMGFLLAKLVFTAFCYGSGIPAGLMVPVLCLGGVCGGVYAQILSSWSLFEADILPLCLVLGMASSFTAAERAPITGLVLVLEMTAAFAAAPVMLLACAAASFAARLAKVRSV